MTSSPQGERIPLGRPFLDGQEEEATLRVLRSGRLAMGPEVAAFEEELARSCERRWAVCVSSGTAALHLAMVALGVGPGRVVRVPAFTFPATANVVRLVGAEVELVDVNPVSWCMRLPDRLATKPLSMPVHQFGYPTKAWDDDVSDAACAIGVRGAMRGVMSCLSFHPRKVLTTGEGGAILGDDEGLLRALRALRAHGIEDFDIGRPGFNYRMTEAAAAMGRVQLRKLAAMLDERAAIARRYRALLDGSGATMQGDAPTRAWQTVAVLLPEGVDRSAVRARLDAEGIETQIASYALHRLAAYAPAYPDGRTRFPVADALHDRGLALPLWNGMGEARVDRVAEALIRAIDQEKHQEKKK